MSAKRMHRVALLALVSAAMLSTWAASASATPFLFVNSLGDNTVSSFDAGAGALASDLPSVGSGFFSWGIAMTPNGKSAYVVDSGDHTLTQYDVGPTGELSPKTPATVLCCDSENVLVSSDGKSAYVPDGQSAEVFQFDIDPVTGQLRPKSPASVPTGSGPTVEAMSPDGRSLYIVDQGASELSQYDIDPLTGTLSPKTPATVATDLNPRGVAISPNGKSVYVANATDNVSSATVSQYTVNAPYGTLTPDVPRDVPTGGVSGSKVVVSPDNRSVYVTNALSDDLSQFDADPATGALTPKTPLTVASGHAPFGGIVISADGRSLYVTNLRANTVSQYDVNGTTGALSPKAAATVATTGGAPWGIVISPDAKSVYVVNESVDGLNTLGDDGIVTQYDVDAGTGALRQKTDTVATGGSPYGVVVSPDGQSVYVANSNVVTGDTISQYDLNSGTGALTPKAQAPAATGNTPQGVAISPDGRNVYVANAYGGTVSQYDVSSATGALSPKTPATVNCGCDPQDVAVSADGRSVYVTQANGGALLQFDVDPATGALTPKNPATVPTNSSGNGLIVSADGKSVYVVNQDASTISQYDANPITGALTPKTPATVATGAFPLAVALSPDGKSVYVTNQHGNSVSQYDVDPATGALRPKTPATVPAGQGPFDVVVSADGQSVYVSNAGDDTVSQYAVGTAGALTPRSPATIDTGSLPSGLAMVEPVRDHAPVAHGDSYTVVRNTPLQVAVGPGVLGNDTDPDHDALSTVLVSGPAHGTVSLSADGSFTYTPPSGYIGPDSFTYQASDGTLNSFTATVSLFVVDPPTATIVAPADNQTFALHQSVSTSFFCTEGAGGPGLAACEDGAGATANGSLNTSQPGMFTYTVTVVSLDGLLRSASIHYTVAAPPPPPAPPSVQITTPAAGASYTQNQVVDANYTCTEGTGGPGLLAGSAGCHGTVANGAAIDTSTAGPHSFSVTATSSDTQATTKTVNYTVAAAVTKLADLKISLSGPAGAQDGSQVAEQVKVQNAGPSAASGVITALGIPAGLSVGGAGGGTVSHSVIYWTAATIPAGGSVTYTVTLKVGASAHGNALLAAATASTQIKDPNYANNATATTVALSSGKPAHRRALARVSKRRSPYRFGPGLVTRLERRTLRR